jgi:hypothetical protein
MLELIVTKNITGSLERGSNFADLLLFVFTVWYIL